MGNKLKEAIYITNKPALEFVISAIPRIKEVCKPLNTYLGINCFSYFRIYNDCKYLALINGHEEFYKKYSENIQKWDPKFIQSLKSVKIGEPHFFLWPITYDKLPPIAELDHEYNIWHGFNISFRKEGYCEIFTFTFDKQANDKTQFFLQNSLLLVKFSQFFKGKVIDLIDDKNKNKIAIYPEKFDFDYAENDTANRFLTKIDSNITLYDKYGNLVSLTKRESDCLKILANNKTIKEVGLLLNLSPRTVECHINNIKQKLGMNYKNQLINGFINQYY